MQFKWKIFVSICFIYSFFKDIDHEALFYAFEAIAINMLIIPVNFKPISVNLYQKNVHLKIFHNYTFYIFSNLV